jgi:hypothetical protein
MLKTINKNILDVESGIICQQVNSKGVMGSGLAKQIKDKWPIVFDKYSLHINHFKMCKLEKYILGSYVWADVTTEIQVLNIFGQDNYGRDKQYTDYKAVEQSFKMFKADINRSVLAKNTLKQMYVPFKMGCGLGGGDWTTYSAIIEKHFPTAVICKHDN